MKLRKLLKCTFHYQSAFVFCSEFNLSVILYFTHRTEKLTAERRAAEAEIQERLRKFQIVDPELLVVDDFEDVVEEPEFIELTQEHRARINAAICGPPDQVCCPRFVVVYCYVPVKRIS